MVYAMLGGGSVPTSLFCLILRYTQNYCSELLLL